MAFHPYPQLIPQVFNPGGFGPPRGLTRASTWPWVDHSASGLGRATKVALFGLAFATATPHRLTSQHTANSQAHSSKGTQSRHTQQVGHATLPRLVGTRFQVLFHSAPAVLFTIPSRYYPLSVTREYLGLAGGPARFTRDFSGPVLLGCLSNEPYRFQLRGSYPLRRTFRMSFDYPYGF